MINSADSWRLSKKILLASSVHDPAQPGGAVGGKGGATLGDLSGLARVVSGGPTMVDGALQYDGSKVRTYSTTAAHCSALQYTATRCNWRYNDGRRRPVVRWQQGKDILSILLHTATHCYTLLHTATHRNTLQHTATHCNTLQHIATHCNTLQHTATRCNTLEHSITLYDTL